MPASRKLKVMEPGKYETQQEGCPSWAEDEKETRRRCSGIQNLEGGTCGPEFKSALYCFMNNRNGSQLGNCSAAFKALQNCIEVNNKVPKGKIATDTE